MNLKKYLLLILIITAFGCKSSKMKSVKFSSEKLHGEWLYIDNYEGVLTKIDTLSKELKKNKFVSTLTFKEDGKYTSFQGDYFDSGTFTFDENNGTLKEYWNEGTTKKESKSRITHLDDQYLLLVVFEDFKESTGTFFYKRK